MSLWRVEEAAEYLGIRPKTLYEWVRTGRVPYRKLGFNVRFDPDELRAWVQQQPAVSPAPQDGTVVPTIPQAAPAPVDKPPDGAAVTELIAAATEAARQLRRVETDLGAHLSFPQRQVLRELARRVDQAARDCGEP